jgi:hypothetical protein
MEMQARAGAIDELMASGALEDPMGMGKDSITAELEQMASTSRGRIDPRSDEERNRCEPTRSLSSSSRADSINR